MIPCKTLDISTRECIDHCLKMEYSNYEILVLPDYFDKSEKIDERVHVIPTGTVKPMAKRFMAGSASHGTFCAFLDSDAYPSKHWLRNAMCHFSNPDISAVVGPSLTPDDDLMAQASGLVLASPLGGGSESIRYGQSNSHVRYIREAPTCNFIIRKSVLNAIKDLVPDIWPGEEIVLCGRVTNDLKNKIIYDPNVVVYHHRRRLFLQHLRQIWKYGAVKGYLLKKYPQYVRSVFFLPSFLVLGLFGGLPWAMLNPVAAYVYFSLSLVYVFILLINSVFVGLRKKSIKVAFLVMAGTITTHICYGLAFIRGILSKNF